MRALTDDGYRAVTQLAQRYGVSVDAVQTMLAAVSAGGGTMAQFYHSEFGGGGQWMRGGMTMVADMFNSGLQATVNGICNELSSLLATQNVFAPLPPSDNAFGGMRYGGNWWPSELGSPSTSGGQNDSRYAYFPGSRRLAVEQSGRLSVYDTLDHHIGGVQQQQGGASGSFSFTSQNGTFSVESLPLAPESPGFSQPAPTYSQPRAPTYSQPQAPAYSSPQASNSWASDSNGGGHSLPSHASHRPGRTPDEILAAIERLGELHRKGLLSDSEFQGKKSELLAQL